MKTKIKILTLLSMLFALNLISPQKVKSQVTFQVFYDELSPYGTWIEYADYGFVWMPDAPNFSPYSTNGYWLLTDAGWTWVSSYPWGWAPFHYGRWYIDAYYGPIWIPDYEWGPGWVTWRRSGNYYGWAPIGPGVSISYAYGNDYNPPYNYWTFVHNRNFGRSNINNYYVNNSNNVTIINNSTVINNTHVDKSRNVTYNEGPDRNEAGKYAGKTFTPVTIKDLDKPGQNTGKNGLQLYRPNVQKNKSEGQKSSPTKVTNLKDVKTPAQRNASTPSQKKNNVNRQQPVQQKNKEQQIKQKPVQKQKQQQNPSQQKSNEQQNIQKQPQPQKTNPDNGYEGAQPRQNESGKNGKEVKPSQQNNQPNKVENTNQPPQNNNPKKVQRSRQPKQKQPSKPPKK